MRLAEQSIAMNRILPLVLFCICVFVGSVHAETLNPGGPYMVGDLISIHGDTNYNTDNRILIEVYPASFGPTKKYEPSMTGGASTVVPVVTSSEGGYSWSANISSEKWNPDQYMVRAEIIGKDYQESAIIILNEKGSQSGILHTNSSANDSGTVPSPISPAPTKRENQSPGEVRTPIPGTTAEKSTATSTPTPTQSSPVPNSILIAGIGIGGVFAFRKKI